MKTAAYVASFWKTGIFHFLKGYSPELCPHGSGALGPFKRRKGGKEDEVLGEGIWRVARPPKSKEIPMISGT